MTPNLSLGINCEFQYAQVNNAAAGLMRRMFAPVTVVSLEEMMGLCVSFFSCLPVERTDVYRKAGAVLPFLCADFKQGLSE